MTNLVSELKYAIEGIVVSRPDCRMGQDYDCACVYCSDHTYQRALADAVARNAATAAHRARIVELIGAFRCLAAIGAAIRSAGAPGAGFARMIHDAGELRTSTGGNLRGFSFRVTGRRGSAKQHFGRAGVCKWKGDNSYGGIKLGLAIPGEEKLAYCSFAQLERIPLTVEQIESDLYERSEAMMVRDATASCRPKLVVALKRRGNGPVAYVVNGRDAGASGQVFWCGPDKRNEPNARLGIRTASGAIVWASAYDCASEPVAITHTERRQLERIAADAVMEGRIDQAREILSQTREV